MYAWLANSEPDMKKGIFGMPACSTILVARCVLIFHAPCDSRTATVQVAYGTMPMTGLLAEPAVHTLPATKPTGRREPLRHCGDVFGAALGIGPMGRSLPREAQRHFPLAGTLPERYALSRPAVAINSSFYTPSPNGDVRALGRECTGFIPLFASIFRVRSLTNVVSAVRARCCESCLPDPRRGDRSRKRTQTPISW